MCKNARIKNEVIEQAKQDTPDVFAVYEQGDDLVGIVKVYNRVLAILCDVHRYGDVEYYSKAAVKNELTPWYIKRLFGLDERSLSRLFTVVPC